MRGEPSYIVLSVKLEFTVDADGTVKMQEILNWFSDLEWARMVPEVIGKMLGFLAGFAVSWYLLFRKKLNALDRLKRGDTDDFVFQMHKLWPIPDSDGEVTLLFRNVAPKTTLATLYDNEAAQQSMKELADGTSLSNPVLQTEGTLGFEMLNDAAGHIAGLLATTPFPRETWLFAMTCEDRQVVRKKCIRGFLIRPDDLQKFADWEWCREKVLVESPWHWFRVVALHRIAKQWQQQEANTQVRTDGDMPLVDKQLRHDRVRPLSLGINQDEKPIRTPHRIEWLTHLTTLEQIGLTLDNEV